METGEAVLVTSTEVEVGEIIGHTDTEDSHAIHSSEDNVQASNDMNSAVTMLHQLEREASVLSQNVLHMVDSLTSQLVVSTEATQGCLDSYANAVSNVGIEVDGCVRHTTSLIAKCEEIDNNIKPVEELALQIKAVKKTLDILEAVCK